MPVRIRSGSTCKMIKVSAGISLAWLALLPGTPSAVAGSAIPIPFVKKLSVRPGSLDLERVTITSSDDALANEVSLLRERLDLPALSTGDSGPSIRLEIADVDLPVRSSAYAQSIRDQGYRLRVGEDGVLIQGRTAAGVFYGMQTLLQLIDEAGRVPLVEISDWPDLAFRGVMVDPARANENADYYERLIRFCGRYKINRLHLHLTDDQNVCLYHEDYPSLLHPHAWRPDQLATLVQLAKRHHIEVIPEIESLGHARVFLRHPEFREILHQTTKDKPAGSWSGTSVPGYTNVLCPASDKAHEYLASMYARTAQVFPYPEIHVGCDEVDMTTCARCNSKSPGITHAEWFARHVVSCRDLAAAHGRRTALWGDMLLQHREIVDRIPTEGTVIYDWHYRPTVTGDSVAFFKKRGFEVVGCPALVCYPYMILPSGGNFENIRRFAEIARVQDILGIDTTIWIPTRYLSDVLWPGMAYAAGQSWAGGNWDEVAFYRGFLADFFGSPEGEAFAQAWTRLGKIDWRLQQFKTSCWFDAETLAVARQQADGPAGDSARRYLAELEGVRKALAGLRQSVSRNQNAWQAIEQSVDILAYTLEHFLASAEVQKGGEWDYARLRGLDACCVEAIGWIEADWDRSRFADDPYKADLNDTGQHLLDRFQKMHAYHTRLLAESPVTP